MPSMRVFELAKELNMPARQMIQKLRTAGVPVSGNFHELSEDQVSRVRNLISGKQSVGDAGLRSRADGTRRVISSRRDPDESQDTEEEPRVITISAKTQQDQPEEDESRPRRRRRRKKVPVATRSASRQCTALRGRRAAFGRAALLSLRAAACCGTGVATRGLKHRMVCLRLFSQRLQKKELLP